MSPTNRSPGASVVKPWLIRSGVGAAVVSCLVSDRRRRRVRPAISVANRYSAAA
ncbi:hypothetical protein [Amycolatopsis sp. H20-H5]|uniref:hypothetical protein n=1 Tax=Amycolatopsis sp. H20-H5 TaxID=3046309 RepID=UPI002DB821C3|nr:hypothetical protein [Amycolatopsis sp. H20-H5]MEC3974500.1 hypothetical protein [Amycolatopsis sp. H20-H5]